MLHGADSLQIHPFDWIARHPPGADWALLYSGMHSQGSGAHSFLASQPAEVITSPAFAVLSQAPWFGYLGYEMLHQIETIDAQSPSSIHLPAQRWMRPASLQRFEGTHPPPAFTHSPPSLAALTSNMSRETYLRAVEETVKQIHAGAFYQANITRKFYGEFSDTPDPFALFRALCALSPSAFSAYLQWDDVAVLSSSPEGFLHVNANGKVTTRPIKGSAAPGDRSLAESLKDKAENLMIVDLMRNDLARSCEAQSVRVESLYDIHEFQTIQQMISTISATRRKDAGVMEVIRGCFPPGSMTGAPKVAAMQWCAQQEKMQRGIYSGALGWIDPRDESADLSVVIRTLIIQGKRFEFQVGGGIVADSIPEAELEESLLKARAICAVLGIHAEALRSL